MSMAARPDLATANPSTIARSEVKSGERLIWADRAVTRRPGFGSLKIVAVGAFVAGFGALWTLIAVSATSNAQDAWRFFPLFGTLFIFIGLAIATAPLWLRLVGGPTIYALTDRRIFMMHGRRSLMVRSTPLEMVGQLIMNEQPDGTGELSFVGVMTAPAAERTLMMSGLYGVPDVRRVRALVEREMDRFAASAAAPADGGGRAA